MKKIFNVLFLFIIFFGFSGCAPVLEFVKKIPEKISGRTSTKAPESPEAFSSSLLQKAQKFEKDDALQMALFHMKIAVALNPGNKEIINKTKTLESTIKHKSRKHFNRGVTFYKKKKYKSARKQFLITLRYNPNHKGALDYLKHRLVPKEYIYYRTKEGDTLKRISKKFYKDPDKDFIIVYFNNLQPNATPAPGTKLKLPKLISEFTQPVFDIQEELTKAQKYLEEKRCEEVLIVADKILEHDHLNQKAVDLKNAAYLYMGMQLSQQERIPEAITMLKKIAPQDEDVEKAILETINKELNKAQNLLQQKRYNEALTKAENILDYDTSNEVVKKFINTAYCQQGMGLTKQKNYAEAIAVFNKADPGYDCIEKGISEVKASMTKESEEHYLKGVKYFLNEELNNAIKEWEKTLALNPEHQKARINIKKAQDLLEKLKKIK